MKKKSLKAHSKKDESSSQWHLKYRSQLINLEILAEKLDLLPKILLN